MCKECNVVILSQLIIICVAFNWVLHNVWEMVALMEAKDLWTAHGQCGCTLASQVQHFTFSEITDTWQIIETLLLLFYFNFLSKTIGLWEIPSIATHSDHNCLRPKSSVLLSLQHNMLASEILGCLLFRPFGTSFWIFGGMHWGAEIILLCAGCPVLDTKQPRSWWQNNRFLSLKEQ